jgi:hypothetical protein
MAEGTAGVFTVLRDRSNNRLKPELNIIYLAHAILNIHILYGKFYPMNSQVTLIKAADFFARNFLTI